MFDLSSAIVLGLVVMGLVVAVRTLIEGPTNRDRIIVGACFAVAVVAVLLVSASDFAHDEVVLKRPLDSLNLYSQLVVAILVMGIAITAWQSVKAVRNVGTNEVKSPAALEAKGIAKQGGGTRA